MKNETSKKNNQNCTKKKRVKKENFVTKQKINIKLKNE